MSTTVPPPPPRRRLFVPLHQLAQSRLTRRDLMLALPALLLSLLLNAVLIGLMIWYGGGDAATSARDKQLGLGTAKPRDATRIVPANTADRDFIDVAAVGPEIKNIPQSTKPNVPAPEIRPEEPAGIAIIPDDSNPCAIGSGPLGGIQGLGG
ncbi:MAG TPA: hypothetical protein PKC45_02840, partial [Gemmatales bacterium]|nr:hypothetical protein [Gemmatales bacterium]